MSQFETIAIPVPAADDVWPLDWAEVPGERFTRDGTEYAVVSVPAGTDDPRIRRDLAPMTCEGGRITGSVVANCPHACPGTHPLWPVELAGRESCHRELVEPT
jgi:hypothetical protein